MLEIIEHVLHLLVEYSMAIFELAGVIWLIYAGVKGIYEFITGDPKAKHNLGHGMEIGMSILMCGEILRTVVVKDMTSIAVVGGIIALRAALTFLIIIEEKVEEKAEEHEEKEHH
ncbi:MAG: DUF1622 domain-containing protein [Erysipelotrichaceae bacterium]|nr:DUF1622 domain-containing protein [Erysipelotrichaceae bacterium]